MCRFRASVRGIARFSGVVVFALAACQPTLNWREVQLPGAGLAMMPCKPDASRRQAALGGHAVDIRLLTCKAANATFAVAFTQLPAGASPQVAQQHWQRSTLAHLKARDVSDLPGAAGQTGAVGLTAIGVRPPGGANGGSGLSGSVVVAAYWFTRGSSMVHAAIYMDNPSDKPVAQVLRGELQEPFFGGVRFGP